MSTVRMRHHRNSPVGVNCRVFVLRPLPPTGSTTPLHPTHPSTHPPTLPTSLICPVLFSVFFHRRCRVAPGRPRHLPVPPHLPFLTYPPTPLPHSTPLTTHPPTHTLTSPPNLPASLMCHVLCYVSIISSRPPPPPVTN